ncbi:MAG: glycosyltransferase [Planctomycetota bacterium]|nr:glycosyltransferase [Planctomycetota bacterium]
MGHLDRMTDSTGLIQHAIYCIPRRESGYTIDDNTRALRLCVRLWSRRPDERMLDRVTRYLSLLEYARRPVGGFHNLMSYQRQWLDTDAGGDCQGQAVRALAEVLASRLPEPFVLLARELICSAIPTLAGLRSLRAQAYIVLACGRLWEAGVEGVEKFEEVAVSAAQQLVECYQRSQRPGWNWFESRMTYANAVLPHAMLIAAGRWPDGPFYTIGREAFKFLEDQTMVEGVFWPIGNNGWYSHSEPKARYDQQPIEAVAMADAALTAFKLTAEQAYLELLERTHAWFHGSNSLGMAMADVNSGACCDGLQLSGLNRNQGAESTLAYLWTHVHLGEADRECTLPRLMVPGRGSAVV